MGIFQLTWSAATQVAFDILAMDLLRYLIGAGGIFVTINLMLRGVLRHRKIRPDSPTARQMLTEIVFSIRTAVIFATVGFFIWLADQHSLLQLYDNPAQYGWIWFVLSIFSLVVLHDAWFYWMHRLIHHRRLFRLLHLRHHRSHNPSPFAAYSFDVGEAVLTSLYFPLVLILLPVSELAAFIFTVNMMLVNALHHCGYEVYPCNRSGKPLLDWLTTTTHHDLHHARGNGNFGLYFTFWDRLMGTEHPEYHRNYAAAVNFRTAQSSPSGKKRTGCLGWWVSMAVTSCVGLTAGFQATGVDADTDGQEVQSLSGIWVTEGYAFIVEFGSCERESERVCGTLRWVWDDDSISAGAWQRPMLKQLNRTGDSQWKGQLVHPETDQIYAGVIRQLSSDILQLEGCIAWLLCDRQIWRRLESLPHVNRGLFSHDP